MGEKSVDYWATVIQKTDIREDADGNHDMGNLYASQPVHVVAEYMKGSEKWLRFDKPDFSKPPQYKETWIIAKDTATGTTGTGTISPTKEQAIDGLIKFLSWVKESLA